MKAWIESAMPYLAEKTNYTEEEPFAAMQHQANVNPNASESVDEFIIRALEGHLYNYRINRNSFDISQHCKQANDIHSSDASMMPAESSGQPQYGRILFLGAKEWVMNG